MLADAFVVLGLGQYLVVLSVCQNEHRAFYTAEEFLDDYFLRGLAKHTVQHLPQFLFRFF